MADDFKYDVFLSYHSKDKPVVHALAERLQSDGLHVWLDEWVDYWLKQDAPVMLVIGTLAGEGERLDLSSVMRWRDKVLEPVR